MIENLIQRNRIYVFIDYWNFQLTINNRNTTNNHIDWKNIGKVLAQKGAQLLDAENNYSFEGVSIYSSFNPNTKEGEKFKIWMTSWLNKQPGIDVSCLERHPKNPPQCPKCHTIIEKCPNISCNAKMTGTIEKGVDTLIVTDMIRLAWERAYDIALLVSCDRDLIPAVMFLKSKGIKVIQAGFPNAGNDLMASCWASFNILDFISEILRG